MSPAIFAFIACCDARVAAMYRRTNFNGMSTAPSMNRVCPSIRVVLDMTILHVAVPTLTQAARRLQQRGPADHRHLSPADGGIPGADGHACEPGRQSARSADGVAIVGFASALAAFTPNAPMLIAARMLPALGGSMIMPCVLGIIRRTFENETERAWRLACGERSGRPAPR